MTLEETKNADLQRVVDEGVKIYQNIKHEYEPMHNGKFLAIDIDSKNIYMADTSAEAVVLARKTHPNRVFYVVKVGYDAVETLATLFCSSLDCKCKKRSFESLCSTTDQK